MGEETQAERRYLDVRAHLRNANYSGGEKMKRVFWGLGAVVFRLTPRPLYGLRNALLRAFGAKIGRGVKIYPQARIMYPWELEVGDEVVIGWDVRVYNLGRIRIGSHVIISQGAHLCAGSHDVSQANLPLLKPPITVGDECWICSDAFIGPGVTLGRGCVIGARSVVVKDLPEGAVAAGNPARVLRTR